MVNPKSSFRSIADLIAAAKAEPAKIPYGTFGTGSSGHLNMVLLETMTGIKLQAVHYKGAAPAMNDFIAGHIQMGFVSAGSAVPQWKGGKGRDAWQRPQPSGVARNGRPRAHGVRRRATASLLIGANLAASVPETPAQRTE